MNSQVARALKRLAATIADEADRNPAFAERIATALGQATSGTTQAIPDGGDLVPAAGSRKHRRAPSAVDPLAVLAQGETVLREALGALDVEQLKDVVAEYGMDTSKLALKWKGRERLENLIVATARERLAKGDAFRRTV